MTAPRRIRPGKCWFLSRRTTRRHFLLRPDGDHTLQQIYWYVTGVVAAKFGIELHAVQVLSTHIHEVLTDPYGELPNFLRERNRLLANAIKCHRKWPEEVFARSPTSCVELYGAGAVLKEIGYTLANCVEAGLVHHPDDWPGVTVRVDDIGRRVIRASRPSMYFNPKNPLWPEEVELQLRMPKLLLEAYETMESASRVLRGVVNAAIEAARATARAAGKLVSCIGHLVRMAPSRQATSPELFGKRNPHFATGGDSAQAALAKQERRAFLTQYREAFDKVKKGFRDVIFPYGAWRLPKEFGFVSASPPENISMSVGLPIVGQTFAGIFSEDEGGRIANVEEKFVEGKHRTKIFGCATD